MIVPNDGRLERKQGSRERRRIGQPETNKEKVSLSLQRAHASRSRHWNIKQGHDHHEICSSTTLIMLFQAVKLKLRFVFSCPVSSPSRAAPSKRFLVQLQTALLRATHCINQTELRMFVIGPVLVSQFYSLLFTVSFVLRLFGNAQTEIIFSYNVNKENQLANKNLIKAELNKRK